MPRLLLYEKNIFMRDTLRVMLQGRIPGLLLEDVYSIKQCMKVLRSFQPDILILNISYHSGKDMTRLGLIREMVPSTVILLLMDYDIDEYRQLAIARGADYIISKDLWTGREILSLIRDVLESRGRLGHVLPETGPGEKKSPAQFMRKLKDNGGEGSMKKSFPDPPRKNDAE